MTDDLIKVTGGSPLSGTLTVQGSKNIALHLYAAAILADRPTRLHHCPQITDTAVCADVLRHLGFAVDLSDGTFTVDPGEITRPQVHPELGRQVRTTVVMAAAVLARCGRVQFPGPGGDAFCERLIDRHLAAMRAAGATVTQDGASFTAVCPNGVQPFLTDVNTPFGPSLGATVTAMLLAAKASGESLIRSPSIEPEVVETARYLQQGGVGIRWDEQGLHVTGFREVTGGDFTVAGDRIEAATLIMASAATNGRLHLDGITVKELPVGLRNTLSRTGISVLATGTGIQTFTTGELGAVQASTGPHPALPTDTAPQFAAMLTQAHGCSEIHERIYPRRDTHVAPLAAFGASIRTVGTRTVVTGRSQLRAADVEAADIRAVTALLIAALAADGTSTIRGMRHLRRGYGDVIRSLATLGATISTERLEST